MEKKVEQTILQNTLFSPGQTVLVALSGGPDSLCLLHILHAMAEKLQIRLHIAHINHRLRPESAAEAIAVKKMAIGLGLPVTVCRVAVKEVQLAEGRSLQEAARLARYGALVRVARRVGASKIATGHHSDDRVETLLMRLLAGSGLEGLKGIPVRRTLTEGIDIVRPLSAVAREEIEAYCRTHKLVPLWDPSNRRLDYLRNHVRLRLLPFLEAEFGRHIRSSLARSADLLARDATFLAKLGKDAFGTMAQIHPGSSVDIDIAALLAVPLALQTRVLMHALWHAGAKRPGRIHVEQLLMLAKGASPSASCPMPGGIMAWREYDRLRVGKPVIKNAEPGECVEVSVPGRTYLPNCGSWLETEQKSAKDVELSAIPRDQACLDAQKLTLPLVARARKPGDKMWPLGAAGTRKVKKILADKKIPLARRSQIPLIISGNKIAWLGGVEIAEDFKVTQDTETVLCLKLVSE